MGQAICRCGQPLEVPAGEVSHLTCPKCSAKVRIIRKSRPEVEGEGGSIRFACPCGRKLKVSLADRPTHGKCPECGRVVPVPADAVRSISPESPTEEMPAADRDRLDAWARQHLDTREAAPAPAAGKVEAGLRVCPRCGKPIHMGSETCRACGTVVPRR